MPLRVARPLLLFLALAVTAGGCARYTVMQAAPAPRPASAAYGIDNVVYGAAPGYAAPAYRPTVAAQPAYAAPSYAAPNYAAPSYPPPQPAAYAPPPAYRPVPAAPVYRPAAPAYVAVAAPHPVAVVPGAALSYAPRLPQPPYTLDSGDRLRIVVFGQEGLTNSYVVDASGDIAMPLIGSVAARGLTTDQLSARIADLLRQGYVREPHVAVEVEAYRPFFILGEVTQPGQYPYVANMTVETAVAIAGGFTPRGLHNPVIVSRTVNDQLFRFKAPETAPVRPGDTIKVEERWF